MYGCVFHKENGFCEKFSDDRCKSYCVMGPCKYAIPSNADRIRVMTDEELANFLFTNVDCSTCTMHGGGCSVDCEKWILSWLKAPVEVDDGT